MISNSVIELFDNVPFKHSKYIKDIQLISKDRNPVRATTLSNLILRILNRYLFVIKFPLSYCFISF